ncbi:hypothetical protein JCM11641_005577 [Rhodosporidiobolus odoratus]
MSLYDQTRDKVQDLIYAAKARYDALSAIGKVCFWLWVAMHQVVGFLFFYIGPDKIFAYFAGLADDIRELPYGWAILCSIVVVTSLPPLVGYGTAQTLIGFAYGVWPGFFFSAGSCLAGGAFAFIVIRRLLHLFSPYISRNPTFEALSKAVRYKGLGLMVMIRLCPFPYPYSNLFFASIETVSLGEFMLATLAITPKLLLHVFIGHRTYLFADPETRKNMDPTSRWLNGFLVIFGSLLGFATSWYLYKQTMRYVAEAEAQGGGGNSENQSDLEAGLLEHVDEMLADETADEEEEERVGRRKSEQARGSGQRWDEGMSEFEDEGRLAGSGGKKVQGDGGRRDSLDWGFGGGENTGEEPIPLGEQHSTGH